MGGRPDFRERLRRSLSLKGRWVPIRWKLLFLLVGTAAIPMALVLGSVLWQFGLLGEELSARSEEALVERARKQLLLLVETSSRFIRKERLIAEQALKLQADALMDSWGGRLQRTGGVRPLVVGPEPGPEVLPENRPVFFIGREAEAARARREVERLAAALPLLEGIMRETAPSLYRQYAAWNSGLLLANPADDLAWTPEFDPRRRPWFGDKPGQEEPRWEVTRATLDQQDLVLSVFLPLVDERGVVVGATGLDVRPGRVIREEWLPRAWRGHFRIFLVRCQAEPAQMMVLAEQNGGEGEPAWRVQREATRLAAADETGVEALVASIRLGRSGVVEMGHEGEPAFWAFAPSATDWDALVLVVPRAQVIAEARAIQEYVWRQVGLFGAVTLVVFFGLAAGVVGISFCCSALFTRPFHAIMETVIRLAEGDFKARAEVRTRDERQTLAEAVNALAPALEEHVELKQSLQLADAVQHHLLPQGPLRAGGVEVMGAAIYSAETGGDYFDYSQVDASEGESVAVAIGDVSGHGIGSALLMATGRALLRGESRHAGELGRALEEVNEQLVRDASSGQFLTVFCVSVTVADGQMRWASAGHDPAMVFNPATREFRELTGGGLALGIMPGWHYETYRGQLAPGEWVVMATDGVWEARRADGEMFGKERLREVIRAQGTARVEEMVRAIQEAVVAFRAGEPQQDDLTVVALRWVGQMGG